MKLPENSTPEYRKNENDGNWLFEKKGDWLFESWQNVVKIGGLAN